jgi:cyclic beta-1,2-glucan glucanotransferase
MLFPQNLQNLLRKVRSQTIAHSEIEEPIRAELFSSERLEQHGESLATAQRVTPSPRKGRLLLPRVLNNGRVLLESYRAIAQAIHDERAITPAADWLVDNYHIVDDQLREIHDDLPTGYYRELPKLAGGPLQGYPRVYGLAWAFVAHTDSRFDPEMLRRFVRAYQRVQPLTIGELWAVAITLRVVLVENLRRLAERIVHGRAARQEADAVADRLLGLGGHSVEPAAAVLARFEGAPLAMAFAVQLVQRLRDQDPVVVPALRWLEERLTAQDTTADEIVRVQHQRQAAMNVTVRNVITSMRLMSAFDWAEFFESVSLVDAVLWTETPFAAPDFATRDRYRHAIEELSRCSQNDELEVARRAVLRAQQYRAAARGASDPVEERREDPGYYLIANGRVAFEEELGYRMPIKIWLTRAYVTHATSRYLGTIAIVSGVILALFLFNSGVAEAGVVSLLLLGLLALVPALDLAIALVNREVMELLGPRALPRLALRDGVPADLRTLVVVPTLLTGHAQIEEQVERLEVHYLANPDGDLTFALLSDWTDASQETMPGDDELLAATVEGIARLNQRHGPIADGRERFLLFHRRRGWNESEGKWIGWERKRGKLHELNRLLRGATDTTFLATDGRALFVPSGVRYIITLDADTRLPRGAAARLVGTIAHPLNRPRFDTGVGRVVEGYALLQPRVMPTIPTGREGSLFQRIFSGPGGMDPYASAISDVYQDLFGEGSYIGKGIYDIDAFEAALAGRVPENALLSHDLFEGIFARAGLVSDIEFFDEFPSHYAVAVARQHRWARGDWQLLPWIIGLARDARGGRIRAPIPIISRWKMLDNLRRTLSAPAAFLTLLAGWTLPFASPVIWTMFVLATIAIPPILPVLTGLIPHRSGISKRSHLRAVGTDLTRAASQVALTLTLLAHQAWLMTDAIVRTLFRVYVKRRNLLEWVTAAQAESVFYTTLGSVYHRMGGAVVLATAAAVLASFGSPGAWLIATPFALLWALSPVVAHWISLPPRAAGAKPLSADQTRTLRLTARRTWRFFETFVGAEDRALPPDNFQEEPTPIVAHRTSPTNLGLYLLSIIAAHDFGWLGAVAAIERLEGTLGSMNALERFRGHFYNWYDTRDLRPLDPKYISSVDSGNLAGHLIALGQACHDIIDRPLLNSQALCGIADAVLLLRAAVPAIADDRRTQTVTVKQLEEALDALTASLSPIPETPRDWFVRLTETEARALTVADIARTLSAERGDNTDTELLVWAESVRAAIASHLRDLDIALPWARLIFGIAPSDRVLPQEQALGSKAIARLFVSLPTLAETPERCENSILELTTLHERLAAEDATQGEALAQIDVIIESLGRSAAASKALLRRLSTIVEVTKKMFDAMDFGFLFDANRKLFSIGYRVTDNSLDPSCYDLLASEARLTSFIAIAKGDVPSSHWFHLGRPLTPVDRGSALVSWSGSMFEYLMPALVMRSPPGSLLDQTYYLIVRRQRKYGTERGVPWGVSESAYNARDLQLTYQYTNFGVPGLGLKRGLSEDVVIAPYATALAAMIDADAAVQNFVRLGTAGARGRYGFYEALDYTPTRVPEDQPVAFVRAYMAHHQGMTLVAIANVLHEGVMCARFHAEPRMQATELLLQERTPRDVRVARPRVEEVRAVANVRDLIPPVLRRFTSPHDATPGTHLLSNGRYAVMVTTAGSGYSRWRDLAVTRWREDRTRDPWGTFIFLRDRHSGAVWSAAYQPSGVEPDSYEVAFSEDHVEIRRRDGAIATTLEVVVSPEHDAEVRRVSITNLGVQPREIELTSYAEIVLAPPTAEMAHPAFSNLFVQTEFAPELGALLATRRPRSNREPQVWAAHVVIVEGETVGDLQYETDRARFLGRCRGIRTPMSVIDGQPLSNTVGAVLDPIVSLRRLVRLAPGATVRLTFSTLIAPSRDEALALADAYHDPAAFERAATLAWTQAQVQLHHLGIDPNEAYLFQELAGQILYSGPGLRPSSAVLTRNTRGASTLWRHGISGDLPIVLVRIDEPEDQGIVRQLLRAHEYWRMRQLSVDLVILNEQAASYAQDLQASLEAQVRTSQSHLQHEGHELSGSVFILRGDLLSAEDRTLLQTAARAMLLSHRGTLTEQVVRQPASEGALVPLARRPPATKSLDVLPPLELEFFNGLGGFAADGREYVTILGEGQWTPAPWINVIANPSFGFQVSESGSGYTWSLNSRENQLTPWSNDPVSDPTGETIYVRDEDGGELWSPTVLPIREEACPYVARHGPGYSRFEHASHGVSLGLLQFVPLADPIKICRLTIENHSGRSRRLSVTAYAEWVLGVSRSASAAFIVTEIDPETGAMLARNAWNSEFGGRVAFADFGGRQTAWTGDRTEFLGRNGTLDHPISLERGKPLSGKVGAGLDPCAALQAVVELRAGGRAEIVFFLGEAANTEEARALIARYRAADLDATLRTVTKHWNDVLGAVQVTTPDRAMNIMLNRWLLYQTLACRVWARAAFYQAGGAYGFRDQLQDVMALTVARRDVARAQLLRAAARQFVEGDVQHWWHPPSGRGVRTRISDDLLWLPYAVIHYLEVTGDVGLLDEIVSFLDGPPLADGQDESYFEPRVSVQSGTLFEHCARALDRSLVVGSHGLPLIGTGDWNDGMNQVGSAGKGESVWLGWFLHSILWEFAKVADLRGEHQRAELWRLHVSALKASLELKAWDGEWYRRAYFDDGTPLGSATNDECRIDSIAQSWGVISGAADRARGARAMAAVEKYLVRRDDGLVLLFTPPFDRASPDPGYIKGYLPGVRENGGQYTHGAIWSVLAFAALGDGDKAGELFTILNPINHASTRAGVYRYKVEPYVIAADIYSEPPHIGRGGWTWYTGSAGWMYRGGIEWILGFRLRGAVFEIDPCIPRAWPGFKITFRYQSSRYEIVVENPHGVSRGVSFVEFDGTPLAGGAARIPLADDSSTHHVRLVLGAETRQPSSCGGL